MKTTPRNTADRSLFPLRIVPFERMMLLDDRADYPMTCGATFYFEGKFDRERFEEALREALDRHPLFRAQVRFAWGHPSSWVAAKQYPQVTWLDEAEAEDFESSKPINLRQEPGLRIWVKEIGSRSELIFDFHHACADGAGGLLFVEDLLTLYAAKFTVGRPHALPSVEPMRLLGRGRFLGSSHWSVGRMMSQLPRLSETCRFASYSPQPLHSSTPRPLTVTPTNRAQRFTTRMLDPATASMLRATAVKFGATLNDLLIAALFQTLQQWNTSRRPAAPRDLLRILMPANLRGRADLNMPAANCMSYAFLTQRGADAHDFRRLIGHVAAETNRIRRLRLPLIVIDQMSYLDTLRLALPLVLSSRWCFATAVLSNVGDPTRRFRARLKREDGLLVAGNVRLTGLSGITSLRPLTRASLFVNSYADRLTINARLDPNRFSVAEAERFLDSLTGNLLATQDAVARRRAA